MHIPSQGALQGLNLRPAPADLLPRATDPLKGETDMNERTNQQRRLWAAIQFILVQTIATLIANVADIRNWG